MNNSFPREFVRALPKAELHVHLEGTIDATTLLALAERHGIEPPADDEDGINDWYRFDGFPAFLERYLTVVSMLRYPEDFAFVAERYLLEAHRQGVVHVEFHVSACAHQVENNKSWPPIYDGIVEGCRRAEVATGISWGLIPDISPHLSASASERAITNVLEYDLTGVVALGMGGPADTWLTDDFAPIFRKAASRGLHLVSHAAEHGGPAEVIFAVEQFGAERIQHGIGVMADPAVVQLLVERGIACDVCPGSNLALQAVDSPAEHPLPAMLDAGIMITLGSDDPPMFQTNLLDEYERAWEWCSLTASGLRRLAANSLEASFASRTQVNTWVTQLEAVDPP